MDNPPVKKKWGKPATLSDLLAMQRVLKSHVMNPDLEPRQAAQCACAWERLEERRRILRNRPLPGNLRPELDQLKSSRRKSRLTPLSQYSDAIPITAEPVAKQLSNSAEPAAQQSQQNPEA